MKWVIMVPAGVIVQQLGVIIVEKDCYLESVKNWDSSWTHRLSKAIMFCTKKEAKEFINEYSLKRHVGNEISVFSVTKEELFEAILKGN